MAAVPKNEIETLSLVCNEYLGVMAEDDAADEPSDRQQLSVEDWLGAAFEEVVKELHLDFPHEGCLEYEFISPPLHSVAAQYVDDWDDDIPRRCARPPTPYPLQATAEAEEKKERKKETKNTSNAKRNTLRAKRSREGRKSVQRKLFE